MADAQIKITADTSQAERALGSLTSALRTLAGIAIGGNLVQQFVEITASAQEMTNKLIFATGSLQEANKTFGLLARTARETGSDLGGTIDLFQKLAQSSTLAGSSQESLAYITKQFNKTLQISGASGAGAASALYQFAQAMQKGTLNGDEFRTIAETNGYLLKVLEKQTGKTATELRQMSTDGRLSVDLIAQALVEASMINEDYGNTVVTINQAYNNLNTSVTEAIKNFSDATGIGNGLAKVLNLMADNAEIVIGVIAGIGVAVAALLIPLIPAATAMAILTGGAAVVGAAAVGGAIAYAAKEAGLFGEKVEKANKSQAEQVKQAQQGLKITKQRNTQALDLDKNLTEQIGKLRGENDILQKGTGIRSLQLEVEKALSDERNKYKKTGQSIPAQLEKELAIETRRKILIEESLKTKQKFLELESSTATLGIQDQGQRQITAQLEQYRLSVTKETYELNKDSLEIKIRENLVAQSLQNYTDQQRSSAAQLLSLDVQDLDLRQEQLAVDVARVKEGVLFNDQMEKQIRLNEQNLRKAREILETEKQRNLLTGTATNQTQAERIATATGVIAQSDPRLAMAQEYATKSRAINEAIRIEEEKLNAGLENNHAKMLAAKANLDIEYKNAKELADIDFLNRDLLRQQSHNDALLQKEIQIQTARIQLANKEVLHRQAIGEAILAMEQKVADARLKLAGVNNQAILDSVKQNIANVKMIQQGGVVGIQGMLGAMMSVTGQMAATNKRAFEAHKAMAMAQAIISTYQAAAMAIAFPPGPPLSFIYVAGAIAAGLAQVAAIRAQQYSGRALGGPVMGGRPYIVGENGPELFTPATTGSITRNSDLIGGGTTNVNFTIVANDTTGFDQLLASRKGVIQQIISDAMLEKGRRSMV